MGGGAGRPDRAARDGADVGRGHGVRRAKASAAVMPATSARDGGEEPERAHSTRRHGSLVVLQPYSPADVRRRPARRRRRTRCRRPRRRSGRPRPGSSARGGRRGGGGSRSRRRARRSRAAAPAARRRRPASCRSGRGCGSPPPPAGRAEQRPDGWSASAGEREQDERRGAGAADVEREAEQREGVRRARAGPGRSGELKLAAGPPVAPTGASLMGSSRNGNEAGERVAERLAVDDAPHPAPAAGPERVRAGVGARLGDDAA